MELKPVAAGVQLVGFEGLNRTFYGIETPCRFGGVSG